MSRTARTTALLSVITLAISLGPPTSADVETDITPPTVSVDGRKFIVGSQVHPSAEGDACPNTTARMHVFWHGEDAESGIAGYTVYRAWDPLGEDDYDVVMEDTLRRRWLTPAGSADCGGQPNGQFMKVEARDRAGNTAAAYGTFENRIHAWQEDGEGPHEYWNLDVVSTGTWLTSRCECFDDGETRYSTEEGAAIAYTGQYYAGTWIALVMPKGPGRGEVSVTVGGGAPMIIDTYAPRRRPATVVWQYKFTANGPQAIEITNVGTEGHSRVDVDSILTSRFAPW